MLFTPASSYLIVLVRKLNLEKGVRALDGGPPFSKVSHISTAVIAGILFVLIGAARANEADDQIARFIAQARQKVAAHAFADAYIILGEIAELLPNAELQSLQAVLTLTDDIRQLSRKAQGESSQPAVSPEPTSPAARFSHEPLAPDFPSPSDRPASLSSEPPLAAPGPPAADPLPPALPLRSSPAVTSSIPPSRVASSQASVALLGLLQRQGDTALRGGDISGARRFYQRGAESGCGACAEALAQTYDADQLRRLGTVGIKADPAQADAWRTRARELTQSKPPQ